MEKEIRFNVLKGFNYDVLNDPEYGEDSVREEIIFPIIKALGYTSHSNNRIIRSRKLLHPFVSIGSIQKKIYIIPDYVMEINKKTSWIMEAKAPNQDILKSKHVEQAYSYAIHSEVRAEYYALCNGKEFVLYHVSEYKPVLYFDIRLLPSYWGQLNSLLSPENLYNNSNRKLSKDLGLHLKRLGFDSFKELIFPRVPIEFICKMKNDLYTFGTGFEIDQTTYCASFDFNHEVLLQLKNQIPDEVFNVLKEPIQDAMIDVRFCDALFYISIGCKLDGQIVENEDEIFLPLTINRIIV